MYHSKGCAVRGWAAAMLLNDNVIDAGQAILSLRAHLADDVWRRRLQDFGISEWAASRCMRAARDASSPPTLSMEEALAVLRNWRGTSAR